MRDYYDTRIERAVDLAEELSSDARILVFYARLLMFQQKVFRDLKENARADLEALRPYFPALVELVNRHAPEFLKDFANERLKSGDTHDEIIRNAWGGIRMNEQPRFFGRALMQPYSEYLASRGAPGAMALTPVCPFCGAKPVTGVLRGEGEASKRSLICSLCATEWPYRRAKCPHCGEEDKAKLPVFAMEERKHVVIEACNSCGRYLKTVDLAKNDKAVPVVEDVATISMAMWACEHGYARIEANALGT